MDKKYLKETRKDTRFYSYKKNVFYDITTDEHFINNTVIFLQEIRTGEMKIRDGALFQY